MDCFSFIHRSESCAKTFLHVIFLPLCSSTRICCCVRCTPFGHTLWWNLPFHAMTVEERTYWLPEWGTKKWMLIAAGAKRPSKSELNYINIRIRKTNHVSMDDFLPCNLITGMVLFEKPDDSKAYLKDARWKDYVTCNEINSTKETQKRRMHWRATHVLAFHNAQPAPWLLQGVPKPLYAYHKQGRIILDWVRRVIKYRAFEWVRRGREWL